MNLELRKEESGFSSKKYLGVILDEKLEWKLHVDTKIVRAM